MTHMTRHHLAVIFFIFIGILSCSAHAEECDCPGLYAKNGAFPGEASCRLNAAAASGGMACYFCTGSSGLARIDAYCGWVPNDCSADTNGSLGMVGNPINVATGDKIQKETDYEDYVENDESPRLDVARYYTSNTLVQGGIFGPGWKTAYERSLKISGTEILAARERGNFWLFKRSNAVWATDTASNAGITETKDSSGNVAGYILNAEDGSMESYNLKGQVVSVTDFHGSTLAFTYQNSKLYRITDQRGRFLEFSWNTAGYVSGITTPDGKTISYQYGTGMLNGASSTRLDAVMLPGNSASAVVRKYVYGESQYTAAGTTPNADFKLTGIIDETGTRVSTYGYDASGRAILTTRGTDNAGRQDIAYLSSSPWTAKVTNSGGRETTFVFSKFRTQRLPLSVTGAPSQSCAASYSSYTYDANGFRDKVVDRNGNTTDFDYDATGMKRAVTTSAGTSIAERTEFDWYDGIKLPREIRTATKTTNYEWEGRRVLKKTETDTSTNTAPYSTNGKRRTWSYQYTYYDGDQSKVATVREDGPRTDVGDVYLYQYLPNGLMSSMTDPAGHVWKITSHTLQGRPERLENPNGLITTLTYHPRGWLQSRSDTANGETLTTRYEYHENGNLTAVILPDGSRISMTHDDAGRLKSVSNALGEKMEITPDSFGNPLVVTMRDGAGNLQYTMQQEFDELGQLRKILSPSGQALNSFRYDANGNLEAVANGQGQERLFAFDALDRVASITQRDGGAIELGRNSSGDATSIKDPRGNVTRYVFDGFGRVVMESSPERGNITYWHDESDNLIQKVDAQGVMTQYRHDGLNRLVQITYPSAPGKNVDVLQDQTNIDGRVSAGIGKPGKIMHADGSSISWVYDLFGRMTDDIRKIQGVTYQASWKYGVGGRLIEMTYPGGRMLSYAYDNAGRIVAINTRSNSGEPWATLISNVQYLPFGPVAQYTLGNGLTEQWSYDSHYRTTAIKTASGSQTLRGLDYGYNENGDIASIANRLDSSHSELFSYDPEGRLGSARGGYGSLGYSYDTAGNRLSQTKTGSPDGLNFTETYTVAGNSNRLLGVTSTGQGGQSVSMEYDAAGNTVKRGEFGFDYSGDARLAKATRNSVIVGNYEYNAIGQRHIKTAEGKTSHFIYGAQSELLTEASPANNSQINYVYLGSRLVAMITSGTTLPPTPADLVISLTGKSGSAVAQSDGKTYLISYEIAIVNNGGSTSSNVVLTNTYPAGVTGIKSIVADQGSCDTAGAICQLGSLDPGKTVKVQVTTIEMNKTKENYTSVVAGTASESDMSNNSKTAIFGGNVGVVALACLALMNLARRKVSTAHRRSTLTFVRKVMVTAAVIGAGYVSADEINYVHTDHLGTPTMATNQTGQMVWKADHQPFGETKIITSARSVSIRFPGQYFDGETGLNYNYFRDYDPAMGRYLQSDPIGRRGGINTYIYVGGNPLNRIDMLGLYQCSCINVSPSGGGNGQVINGRKQFEYRCTCACPDGKEKTFFTTGGSQGTDSFGNGQTALGSDLATGVSLDGGSVYSYATGFHQFPVDTDPPWYRGGGGENTLDNNIEKNMSTECRRCENK